MIDSKLILISISTLFGWTTACSATQVQITSEVTTEPLLDTTEVEADAKHLPSALSLISPFKEDMTITRGYLSEPTHDNVASSSLTNSAYALDFATLNGAAALGKSIYAIMEGTVYKSGWSNWGYGWHLITRKPVGSNVYYVHYAHLQSKPALAAGSTVQVNTLIGKIGKTGGRFPSENQGEQFLSPHLHLAVYVNPNSADLSFIEGTTTKDKKPTVDVFGGEAVVPRFVPEPLPRAEDQEAHEACLNSQAEDGSDFPEDCVQADMTLPARL